MNLEHETDEMKELKKLKQKERDEVTQKYEEERIIEKDRQMAEFNKRYNNGEIFFTTIGSTEEVQTYFRLEAIERCKASCATQCFRFELNH